jgi:hypothetical protein
MKENNTNRNIWAEKLNQLPLPEAAPMWEDMKSRLDRAMPEKKKNHRRWIIFFLLLFIGTATVLVMQPGSRYRNSLIQRHGPSTSPGKTANQKRTDRVDSAAKRTLMPGSLRQQDHEDSTSSLLSSGYDVSKDTNDSKPALAQPAGLRAEATPVEGVKPGKREKIFEKKPEFTGGRVINRGNEVITGNNQRMSGSSQNQEKRLLKKNILPDVQSLKPVIVSFSNMYDDTAASQRADDIPKLLKRFGIPDTTTHIPPSGEKQKPRTSYAFAVGVNQFFALGEQAKTRFNSKGESGTWSDYLPVPQFRIHHGSRLHAQLEVQFNTPQYTKQLTLDRVMGDTNQVGHRVQQTIFIKKLFYFNAPLSVHYRFGNNFTVGAGVQYARLTNAVAFREEKNFVGSRPDSNTTGKIITIKGDSVYQRLRTNEIRFLVDASYRWRNFHAGIRYNQALTPFVNYRISNTEITQARNNSLQAYIRYTLFEW